MSDLTNCPREECGAVLDSGVCRSCGYGSKLSDVPDYESGRLFDEWFFSVPREIMEMYGHKGIVQDRFDAWRSTRSTKH
jgi:hypothetical protein